MINAEYKSEERYSKLSIVFSKEENEEQIFSVVNSIIEENPTKPEVYTCDLPHDQKVLVIEYHDGYDHRSAGPIFDKMMKQLGITHC
jgi:hypothetical protein